MLKKMKKKKKEGAGAGGGEEGEEEEKRDITLTPEESIPIITLLVDLWLLADRLSDSYLRTATIHKLITYIIEASGLWKSDIEVINPSLISTIYASTTPGRALRRVVVDYYAEYAAYPVEGPLEGDFDAEFKQELLVEVARRQVEGERELLEGCDNCLYHKHDKSHPVCVLPGDSVKLDEL